ncbi:glycosyltransferase involved in cell wall biosynthesis [Metabacillus crassostreae]|uniref:glycosyltransferase n=1 Tax=Metabacillus crassostreae TaxID=929098 RepID=UPI0019575F66|nr:glycosyltransferase [Metabacillus crassostreae]MBM7606262.1 glycosyltransferase involved in cell wall biosynthesis [Metabacillus crassostreae]
MNILMLLYKDIHYDARVKREAHALAEAGHQVFIACVKEYKEPAPFIHKNITILPIKISVKSMKSSITLSEGNRKSKSNFNAKSTLVWIARRPLVKIVKDYIAYYEFYKKVKLSVKGINIDVIHCHDLNTLWQGSMLANDFSSKLVYDSHEIFNEMAGRNQLDRFVGYRVEKFLFQKVDFFITVNTYLRKYLFDRYGEKPSLLVQNIPIINEDELNTSIKSLASKFKFDNEDVILIYQGGFSQYRGLKLIIESLTRLPDKYKLVLIGSGVLKGELIDQVQALNLSKKVFFHDQVPSEELIHYTKQAHIGLVMYEKISKNNFYSTPNKIFEYIQAGIPTVSSNHPGKSVIIEEYKTGVLVEETVNGIINGIYEIENKYEIFKKNCLNAQRELTWDDESLKLVEFYKKI